MYRSSQASGQNRQKNQSAGVYFWQYSTVFWVPLYFECRINENTLLQTVAILPTRKRLTIFRNYKTQEVLYRLKTNTAGPKYVSGCAKINIPKNSKHFTSALHSTKKKYDKMHIPQYFQQLRRISLSEMIEFAL